MARTEHLLQELLAAPPPLPNRPPIGAPILWGMLAMVVILGLFVLWGSLAPLSSAAIAPGQLRAEGNKRTVQHLEGGIITELLVKEGDKVKAGQIMLRLDDTKAGSDVQVLDVSIDEFMATDARLAAEERGAGAVAFPPELLSRARDPRVADLIRSNRELFAARVEAHRNELRALEQQISQQEATNAGDLREITSTEAQMRLIVEEIKGVQDLVDKGLERRPRLLALQRTYAALDGQREDLLSRIERGRQVIAGVRAQIAQARSKRLSEISTERRAAQARAADGRERRTAARFVKQRLDVLAPIDGTVVNLRFHTLGGVVRASEPIVDIAPEREAMKVEARLAPQYIDDVYPGLKAEIRFTALKQREVPPFYGHVEQVSADAFSDERTGISYFKVVIGIDPEQLAAFPDVKLHAGMPADVMIETGDRSLFGALVSPLVDSFHKALREP